MIIKIIVSYFFIIAFIFTFNRCNAQINSNTHQNIQIFNKTILKTQLENLTTQLNNVNNDEYEHLKSDFMQSIIFLILNLIFSLYYVNRYNDVRARRNIIHIGVIVATLLIIIFLFCVILFHQYNVFFNTHMFSIYIISSILYCVGILYIYIILWNTFKRVKEKLTK